MSSSWSVQARTVASASRAVAGVGSSAPCGQWLARRHGMSAPTTLATMLDTEMPGTRAALAEGAPSVVDRHASRGVRAEGATVHEPHDGATASVVSALGPGTDRH
jgi:hypothetical protein